MSRISSSSFKVNSDLEQLVSITNASLAVSDAGAAISLNNIDTSTSTSASSLSNIETNTSNMDSSLTSINTTNSSIDSNTASTASGISSVAANTSNIPAQGQAAKSASLPVVIASDQGALNVDLDSVNGATLNLGQALPASCIPVVLPQADTNINIASLGGIGLGGALPVTMSATNGGSEGNLDNSSSVSSGSFSSEVNVGSGSNFQISGLTTDTGGNPIEIHIAHSSGGTKYKYAYDIYPDSNGFFEQKISQSAINFLSLKYSSTATVTATVLFN